MRGEANENYRKVALRLAASVDNGQASTAVFCSVDHGEGTTSAVLNVARHLAESCNLKPLVVEMNVGRPSFARAFGLDAGCSVQAIAAGQKSPAECTQQTSLNFSVIPAQTRQPRDARSLDVASILRRIIRDLGNEYDCILIDAPPVLKSADALAAVRVVPSIILIVQAGRTRQEMIDRARIELDQAKARIVGAILNRHKRFIPGWIYRVFVR